MTCTHSAVLRYAQARNALHDTSFTYLVPTSLRRIGDISMTNQSSGWLLALPAEQDAGKLLKEVNGRMMTFKKSLEPYVYYYGQFLWGLFPWIPRPSTATEIGQAFWKRYGKVLSAITNVPGPSTKLHWAGHAYSQYVAVIPCASHNGLGLAIASYNEGITLGVNMDLDAEAGDGELFKKGDGFVLAGLFEEAFAELCRKADEVEQAKRAK